MAEADSDSHNYNEVSKMLQDLNKDLEVMLEQMEKISVKATWMAYDMVTTRGNPDLVEQMRRLEESFMQCKEEIEKHWKDILDESKKPS
ncbi:synaptonemal complex central element protein 3 [Pseudophryne corroboree]|uniref:synaptonemal complex central element protein 3 n=1 Tax=Pseudophryne corroboree TaxID=495146 RepID=UPI0030817211